MTHPLDSFVLDKARVRAAFSAAAGDYDAAAVLQQEVGERLLERIQYFGFKPRDVLDLGAGTGKITQKLLKTLPRSRVYALDFAEPMLQLARKRGSLLRKPRVVCADSLQLPFADASFDLVFSNMAVQWFLPLEPYLREVRRVLRPRGGFLFSTCGLDTLKELRTAWQAVDNGTHTHEFLDMHQVGDALVNCRFCEPVVDMEMLTLTYPDVLALMKDLNAIGAGNAAQDRSRGLTGRAALRKLAEGYEPFRREDGSLPLSYEIVYGIGWAAEHIGAGGPPDNAIRIHPAR